ncbi:chaperone modulator CbpM [uncultured Algibacter sp.]|uniref:chaperone modulator CbpM n=1 Tax=uncultured Algibacter sp. TaxID=298659 RepID=UPI0030EEF3B4|tara:strand:- start:534 stop:830 length:297 start_codon:yes stop_codon:yes gene_type:complete
METRDLIPIELVCEHYKVPVSFINALHECQLIELTVEKDNLLIRKTQVIEVEKIIRLHYDLKINIEGIDAIYNLLEQVNALRKEITTLHNRLRLYEDL